MRVVGGSFCGLRRKEKKEWRDEGKGEGGKERMDQCVRDSVEFVPVLGFLTN